MSDVVLSAGVRQNLLSLQKTAHLMSVTQNRLATGKKVNSALDNPANFFTSQALNNRAGDLNALLDSIGQAQKTLEAADQGITSSPSWSNPRSRSPSRRGRRRSRAPPAISASRSPATRPTKRWARSTGGALGATLDDRSTCGNHRSSTTAPAPHHTVDDARSSTDARRPRLRDQRPRSRLGAARSPLTPTAAATAPSRIDARRRRLDFTITAAATADRAAASPSACDLQLDQPARQYRRRRPGLDR